MNLSETIDALADSPRADARRIGRMLATARSAAMRDDARAASAAADRIDRAAERIARDPRDGSDPTDAELASWAREHARDLADNAGEYREIQRAEFHGNAAAAATRAARAAMARPFSGTAARLARVVAELAEIRAESHVAGVSAITTACFYLVDAIDRQNAPNTLGVAAATLAARDGITFDAALARLARERNLPTDPAIHIDRA